MKKVGVLTNFLRLIVHLRSNIHNEGYQSYIQDAKKLKYFNKFVNLMNISN